MKKIIIKVVILLISLYISLNVGMYYMMKEYNKMTTLDNVNRELVSRGWHKDIKSKEARYDSKRGVYDVDVRYKSLPNEEYRYSIDGKDRQNKKDFIDYLLKGKKFKGEVFGSGYCDEDKECDNYLDDDRSMGITETRAIY